MIASHLPRIPIKLSFISILISSIALSVSNEDRTASVSTLEQVKEDSHLVSCDNAGRLEAVQLLFEKMGAQASDISIQTFEKVENIVLRKQGNSQGLIVIGAHYADGCGAVDNWSGIVAMAHIYRTLRIVPMYKTLIFVAFGKEEKGLIGSKAMVKAIDKVESGQYCAMINLDSLGLGAPQVIENISSKKLVMRVADLAKRLVVPFRKGVLYEGLSDSVSFVERKIPAVTIHGLAGDFSKVIHTLKDQPSVVNSTSVYLAYRLALLLVIDIDKCPCDAFR